MNPRHRRRIPAAVVLAGVLAAAVLAAAVLAGCGGSSSSTGGAGAGSITVYSGQHQQTATTLTNDFRARTGISVNLRSSDEAALANQILHEGGDSPADVFYAENPPALTVLSHQGLLAPTDPTTLAKVPTRYDSPRRDWVGVSARSAVLVYNTGEVTTAALPASLTDLAGPAWKGRIGFAPTETDFQPLIAALVKLRGQAAAKSWLDGLKSNGKVYDDNETLVAAVNRGDVAAGLIDHYYWYRLRDEVGAAKVRSALHYFAPADPGALVDVSGAAVLKSSHHAAAAQRFLAYLVSPPAQEIIARSESYEYPLGSGVTTAKPLRPFSELRPPAVGIDDLGDGRASLMLLQQVGLI
ncbi:MAG: iron(III) transport system substrate-binding protein [Solirubrobacteraceae bacterium]|nr:iron(III) transport system substrate-binding protein [Solirubrobacteraceae bacterium]